jgi:hypothetical protein
MGNCECREFNSHMQEVTLFKSCTQDTSVPSPVSQKSSPPLQKPFVEI